MTNTIFHHKLIRDRIPEIIAAAGEEFETRLMDEEEFVKELKKKLMEEAREVCEAGSETLPEELADSLEILHSLAAYHHIPFAQIEKLCAEKRKKGGGFDKKLMLIWTSEKTRK